MNTSVRLPEELIQPIKIYKQFRDRWRQEGPLFQLRNFRKDLQSQCQFREDCEYMLDRLKLRIKFCNLKTCDSTINAASIFLIFCEGNGLQNLVPRQSAVVSYSATEEVIADFNISSTFHWLVIVVREDLFNNQMFGQRSTVKQLSTDVTDDGLSGFLRFGQSNWIFVHPLHMAALNNGNYRCGATLSLRKGQLNRVNCDAVRVDFFAENQISDFKFSSVGGLQSANQMQSCHNNRKGDLVLEIITQVLEEQQPSKDVPGRSSVSVVQESQMKQKIFYNFHGKLTAPVTVIKHDSECVICRFKAKTYLGLCLHISHQHSMLMSCFDGNQINIRINQEYLDQSGEFTLPEEPDNTTDEGFVMANGNAKRQKILHELRSQIYSEDSTQQLRISASPSKNVNNNLRKLGLGEQEQDSRQGGVSNNNIKNNNNNNKRSYKKISSASSPSSKRFDPQKQAQLRDSCIAQFGTRFFSSKYQTPLSKEQLENLKDSDDEYQEDYEFQKRLAWADVEENLQCLSVNGRKVKFLWKLFLQYNPCHADRYLFGICKEFVQQHKEELSVSIDMIREVQAHFLVMVRKFRVLKMAELAELLQPLQYNFYNKQLSNTNLQLHSEATQTQQNNSHKQQNSEATRTVIQVITPR